jgi:hypothetical protein
MSSSSPDIPSERLTLSPAQFQALEESHPRVAGVIASYAAKTSNAQATEPPVTPIVSDSPVPPLHMDHLSPEDQQKLTEITAAFPRNKTKTPLKDGFIGDKWDNRPLESEKLKDGEGNPIYIEYKLNAANDGIIFVMKYTDANGVEHTNDNIPF